MSERAMLFRCPYCENEAVLPAEKGRGEWECHVCDRAFTLSFLGLLGHVALGAWNGTPHEET